MNVRIRVAAALLVASLGFVIAGPLDDFMAKPVSPGELHYDDPAGFPEPFVLSSGVSIVPETMPDPEQPRPRR